MRVCIVLILGLMLLSGCSYKNKGLQKSPCANLNIGINSYGA